jgi:uncharacterized protein with NRDE domain
MCTFTLLHRPGADWPVLAAANRDEMLNRPWQAPAPHWPDLPGVVGGRDTLAGGTWLAVNTHGMVAAVLNRTGSLGPAAGKRSRGDLPLLALGHASAAEAADTMARLDAGEWRSFNVVVADARDAYFARGLGHGLVEVRRLPPGLSMVTSGDPNDLGLARVARHLPRFAAALAPEPPDWGIWPTLLADAEGPLEASLNVPETRGFGTASAALIASGPDGLQFLFAGGRPGTAAFEAVLLDGA